MKLQHKLAGLGLLFAGAPVFAAVPTSVTDALTAASADAATVAGAALAIVIAIYGFKAMRRAL